jgi:hypothetical protein
VVREKEGDDQQICAQETKGVTRCLLETVHSISSAILYYGL